MLVFYINKDTEWGDTESIKDFGFVYSGNNFI